MRLRRLLAAACTAALLSVPAQAAPSARREVADVGPEWDPYHEYLRSMMALVQAKWDAILTKTRDSPPTGGLVAVKFTVDALGRVTNIAEVGNTSTDKGEESCLSAVVFAAPFGPWSDAMRKSLGTSREVILRFYY